MSTSVIGIVEFIDQLKQELMTIDGDPNLPPLFLIDEVIVEMSVGAVRSGEGGVTLFVLQLGGKLETEHVQKVSITLTPLLDRETRIRMLDPEMTDTRKKQILAATVKGGGNQSLNELL